MKYSLYFGPETMTIQMEGVFSFHDTRAFHRMLGAMIGCEDHKDIRVDVKNLESIDATALRLLMMVHDAAKKLHCFLVFDQPRGQVLKALNEAARYNMLNIAS